MINAIIELAEECANEPWDVPEDPAEKKTVHAKLQENFAGKLREAYQVVDKKQRQEALEAVRTEALESIGEDNEAEYAIAPTVIKDLERDIVRGSIIETGNRIDGRRVEGIRPILSEVGVLPRTHGSALFTRGETQAMVTTTLGTGQDEQIVDALEGEYRQRSCCTTTSRPTRWAKPAAWRPRAGARSATASWPGARSTRSCRPRRTSPTPCGCSPRSPRVTAPPRWRPSAAPRCR